MKRRFVALLLTAAMISSQVCAVNAATTSDASAAGLTEEILNQIANPDNEYQPGVRMATQSGYDGDDENMEDIVEQEIREAYANGLSTVEIQTNGSVGTSDYIETLIRYYELGNELGIAMELRVGGAGSVQGGSPMGIYYAQQDLTGSTFKKGTVIEGTDTVTKSQTFTDELQTVIAVQYTEDADGNRTQTDVKVLDTKDFTYESDATYGETEDTSSGDVMGGGGFGGNSTKTANIKVTYNGDDVELGDGTWAILAFYNGYDPNGSGMDNTDFYSQASTQVIIENTLKNLGQQTTDPQLKERSDYLLQLMKENGNYGALFAVDGGDSNQILSSRTFAVEMFDKCEDLYGYDFREYMAAQYAKYSLGDDLTNQKMRNNWKEIYSYLCNDYYTTLENWAETEFNAGFRAQIGFATELDTGVVTEAVKIADTESYWPSSGGSNYNFDVATGYQQVTSGSHLLRRSITTNVELGAINGAHGAGFVDWLVQNVNKAVYGGANNMLYHVYESQAGNYFGFGYDGSMQSFGNSNPQYTAMDEINDYVAREQYVTRQGEAVRDIAVYEQVYDATSSDLDIYDVDDSIEEAGYTYDILNPGYMDLDNCYAENGVIDPTGGRYKALVVYQPLTVDTVNETLTYNPWAGYSYGPKESYNDGQYISLKAAKEFVEYAKAGVPIVVVGDYTTFHAAGTGESDEELVALFKEIDEMGMLYTAADKTDVVAQLKAAGITSDVQKTEDSRIVSWEQSYTKEDEGVDATFYWLFNYQKGEGTTYNAGETVSQTLKLKGTGTPYVIDLWSGEVSEVADYQKTADGYIQMDVSLAPYDTAMYVIVDGDQDPTYVTGITCNGETAENASVSYNENGDIVLTADKAGVYTVALSTGETVDVEVQGVEDPITLKDFSLSLESWISGYGYTQGKKSVNDTIVKTTLNPVEITDLANQTWDKLTFTDADGNEIAGQSVSGIGTYTAQFKLTDRNSGAVLNVGDVYDTVKVYVNGKEVPTDMTDATAIDISDYVIAGTNTVAIEVASDLQNVCLTNGSANSGRDSYQSYGLYGTDNSVIVTPVKRVVLPSAERRAADAEIADAKAQIADLQKQIEAAKAEAAEAKAAAKAAEETAKAAEEKAATAQAAAEAAAKDADAAKAEVAAAQAEAKAAAEAAEAAKAEAETAKAAAEEAKAELAALKAQLAAEKFADSQIRTSVKRASKSKTVKVTWTKVKGADGYQVKYAQKANMKGAKKVTVKTTTKTLKGLKKGARVYVKVRAYKTLNGKKVYTSYTAAKSVKVK